MTQPSLLDDLTRKDKPWKRQRSTAREVYRERRKTDRALQAAGLETKEAKVLRCLAAHWNATQTSPTARELLEWMKARGEQVEDVNDVRPKIFYLCEAGLVESGTKRHCRVSGKTVMTWRVREMGS